MGDHRIIAEAISLAETLIMSNLAGHLLLDMTPTSV